MGRAAEHLLVAVSRRARSLRAAMILGVRWLLLTLMFGTTACAGAATAFRAAAEVIEPLANTTAWNWYDPATFARPAPRHSYALRPGDVVEEDSTGQVTAVRHNTSPPRWTRFKPGATSPSNLDVVVGEPTSE